MYPRLFTSSPVSLSFVVLSCTVALGWSESAAAYDPEDVHVGIGIKAGASMNILTPPAVDPELNPPVPAFIGPGGGIGLSFEALYGDFVGVELDLVDVTATGDGRFIFASRNGTYAVDQELRSRELHIPLLVKGQWPLRWVKPFVAIGPTFVIQRSASYTVGSPTDTVVVAPEPESYTMLTTLVGMHIDLGRIRIPIEIRFNWQRLADGPEDRARYTYTEEDSGLFLDAISVNSAWESQLWFVAGVQYWHEYSPW